MLGRLTERAERAAGLDRLRDLIVHNEIRVVSSDPTAGERPYAITILQADGDMVMAVRPSWLNGADDRQRRALLDAHLRRVRGELGGIAGGLARARRMARWLLAGAALWAGGAALVNAPLADSLAGYARTAAATAAAGLLPAALALAMKTLLRVWMRRHGRMAGRA